LLSSAHYSKPLFFPIRPNKEKKQRVGMPHDALVSHLLFIASNTRKKKEFSEEILPRDSPPPLNSPEFGLFLGPGSCVVWRESSLIQCPYVAQADLIKGALSFAPLSL